mmetsp:Transcript_1087/g.2250  ORF Transcript_1087/g.2250 Transcript_1087/m.2250 type:complete len:763 (-) Transcript_1087:225-2513(-)
MINISGRRARKGSPGQQGDIMLNMYANHNSKEEYLAALSSQVNRDSELLAQERAAVQHAYERKQAGYGGAEVQSSYVDPASVPGLLGAYRPRVSPNVSAMNGVQPMRHMHPVALPSPREGYIRLFAPMEPGGSPVAHRRCHATATRGTDHDELDSLSLHVISNRQLPTSNGQRGYAGSVPMAPYPDTNWVSSRQGHHSRGIGLADLKGGVLISPSLEKERQSAYARELDEQVRQKQERAQRIRVMEAEAEAKRDAELAGYDPWGKGGGGAPIRDRQGNIVTVLGRRNAELRDDGNLDAPLPMVEEESYSPGGHVRSFEGQGKPPAYNGFPPSQFPIAKPPEKPFMSNMKQLRAGLTDQQILQKNKLREELVSDLDEQVRAKNPGNQQRSRRNTNALQAEKLGGEQSEQGRHAPSQGRNVILSTDWCLEDPSANSLKTGSSHAHAPGTPTNADESILRMIERATGSTSAAFNTVYPNEMLELSSKARKLLDVDPASAKKFGSGKNYPKSPRKAGMVPAFGYENFPTGRMVREPKSKAKTRFKGAHHDPGKPPLGPARQARSAFKSVDEKAESSDAHPSTAVKQQADPEQAHRQSARNIQAEALYKEVQDVKQQQAQIVKEMALQRQELERMRKERNDARTRGNMAQNELSQLQEYLLQATQNGRSGDSLEQFIVSTRMLPRSSNDIPSLIQLNGTNVELETHGYVPRNESHQGTRAVVPKRRPGEKLPRTAHRGENLCRIPEPNVKVGDSLSVFLEESDNNSK